MAIKIIDHNSAEYQQMVALRDKILRRPLGLSFNPAELQKEEADILIGAFEEEELLGCCLLTREDPKTARLRQMAVSDKLQGKGIGRQMMRFAEDVARDHGFKKITMHARNTAVGFYERLGYEVNGGEFMEVTVPHHVMQKTLL